MIKDPFEYDVAFSFVQKDEVIAKSIYRLLASRIKCFIYSEEQEKIAGTDGETTFNKVFSQESRIVVVLLSKDWGKTNWTRFEETAIRNRGYEEGYDFVILIPTEKEVEIPKWFPKNRIWIGLKNWGVEGAAAVIEARVSEQGGQITEVTLLDKVTIAHSALNRKKLNEHTLNTTEGLTLSLAEFENLKEEFLKFEKDITSKHKDWHIKILTNQFNGINILSYNQCLTLQWHQRSANSTIGSYITITISDGCYNEALMKIDHSYKYIDYIIIQLQFDIIEDVCGWSIFQKRTEFLSSKQVADKYLNLFLNYIVAERQKKGL